MEQVKGRMILKSSELFFHSNLQLKCYGVDASKEMLEIARAHPFERLVCQDIQLQIDFGIQFDAIVCVGVLDFVASIPEMLKKFRQLLKHGGYAGITLPITKNESLNHMDLDSIMFMLEDIGFRVVQTETIFGYQDSETNSVTFYQGFLLQIN